MAAPRPERSGSDRLNNQLFIDGMFSTGTWHSGFLFGGISSAGGAQTRKRRFVEEFLTTTHILGIQETGGVEADLLSLLGPAMSALGGVILAVHLSIVGAASEIRAHTHTHMRSRAITVSLVLGGWVHLTNVRMDPTLPYAQKRRLIIEISHILSRQRGNSYMLGDWNLVLPDESRMSGLGVDIDTMDTMDTMADVFDDNFRNHIELVQRDLTFGRLAREIGGHSVVSIIDRISAGWHPAAFEEVTATVRQG